MIEWIVFISAIVAFLGFNVWKYGEYEKRLVEIEELVTKLLELSITNKEKRLDLDHDLAIIKSHDEEIIHAVKENLFAVEQLDNLMLDIVNNLRPKEELLKKQKEKKKEKK